MNNVSTESHLDFYKRWGELAKPYFKWQLQQFEPYIGQRIADVGCGLGNFVDFFKENELYLGLEITEELSEEFRSIHTASNVKLAINGDITTREAVAELKEKAIDTVICINVLEHIKDDKYALSNMLDGVKEGGHLCLIVPAFPFLFGTLDHLDAHYRRYTKKSFLRLIEGLNVELIKTYYMNFIGGLGWFVKGRILKEKTHGNENYKITNALLPFISFSEQFIKPPFGMSLVAVLQKNKSTQ